MDRPPPPNSRLTTAIAEALARIGTAGATPWHAEGRRAGALARRAYLRALRPYLRRRAEVDLALVDALREAEHDLTVLHARIEAVERALAQATEDNVTLTRKVAVAHDEARRAEGARALHRLEAATQPAGPLDATICTVVSGSTAAHANALARSVQRLHPGTDVLVLVADDAPFDHGVPARSVTLEAAAGGDARHWRDAHDGIALEYALTPVAIRVALEHADRPVIFIKQESMVVGDLRPLLDELGDASIGLTPHFLAPPTGEDAAERTRDVLMAGTFNGGVIVVANDDTARSVMWWWEERLREECVRDVVRGRHFEQRWLDLMAATFDGVAVIRNPGANIGHWNISDRHFTSAEGSLCADGSPVAVMRFSGFDVESPEVVTRYAPHRLKGALGPLGAYFTAFRHELLTHGMGEP